MGGQSEGGGGVKGGQWVGGVMGTRKDQRWEYAKAKAEKNCV